MIKAKHTSAEVESHQSKHKHWVGKKRRPAFESLLRGYSHDIGHQLSIVSSSLETCGIDLEDFYQNGQSLQDRLNNSTILLKSVRSIFDRIQSLFNSFVKILKEGAEDINPQVISLQDFSQEIESKYGEALAPKSINIKVLYEEDENRKAFKTDKEKVLQVLDNLIGNAVDHLLDNDDLKKLIVIHIKRNRLKKNDHLELSVFNQGKLEKPKKVFEEGYSTKGKGRGIGLFFVQKLLQAFGASLVADNLTKLEPDTVKDCFVENDAKEYVRFKLKLENLNSN